MLQIVQSINLLNQMTIGDEDIVKSRSYYLTDERRNVYTVSDLKAGVPDIPFKFLFCADITEGVSKVDFQIYSVEGVRNENGLIVVDCVYENTYKSELATQRKDAKYYIKDYPGWMERPTHDHMFTAPFILTEAYRYHHVNSMGVLGGVR